MLKETFKKLLESYTNNSILINELWNEIECRYSSKKRFYHTLQHLENLLTQLTEVKGKIKNWDIILFTLFYHDLIYNPIKSDNEEKSAELAQKRMLQISLSNEDIELCKNQISATKSHNISPNTDTNYFTDADLCVLGQSWQLYSMYFKNVRKEYSIYPDFLYNPGRKKVLKHFLAMDKIFKTDYFFDKFERQARLNLEEELKLLR